MIDGSEAEKIRTAFMHGFENALERLSELGVEIPEGMDELAEEELEAYDKDIIGGN